ncbi:MAG: hypothetical protein R3192_16615 [Woeseiaceae bacterium]|nr:hypothetical protein [Woeseiaceae bacterium]
MALKKHSIVFAAAGAVMLLSGCLAVPQMVGAHRVVEVTYLADRADITDGEGRWVYDLLMAQGVADADIHDGSVATGRVYCCKDDPSNDEWIMFYAPPGIQLKSGDIVEIRLAYLGKPKRGEQEDGLSTAVRVRENARDARRACRWIPEIEGNWNRILKCDWMETEGWVYQTGLYKTWYKPAGTETISD